MGAPVPKGITKFAWRREYRKLKLMRLCLLAPKVPATLPFLCFLKAHRLSTDLRPRRERYHYAMGGAPTLDDFTEEDVHQLFGFRSKKDLRKVMTALHLPARIKTKHRYVWPGESAFLLMLARLRDGRRWSQFELLFRRDSTALSDINLYMVDWLFEHHVRRRMDNLSWVQPRMPLYAACIHRKLKSVVPPERHGTIPVDIWAFVDGTIRPIAKPNAKSFPGLNLQQELYTGYKKIHGVKYQNLYTPDGLSVHMFGGIGARRHDTTLLRLSGVLTQLHNMFAAQGARIFRFMGDPAYPKTWLIDTGFKGNNLPLWKTQYNAMMSAARVTVEWAFKEINCKFVWLNDKHKNKLGETPVRKHFMVAGFLTNLITCVQGGNQTSDYFECPPPTLETYLELSGI